MSNSRYYIVGDCDMWAIQCAPAEQARCTSRSKVIAFAIDAAQKLGMRGERAHVCVLDHDGHLRSKWTFNRHQKPTDPRHKLPNPRQKLRAINRVAESRTATDKPRHAGEVRHKPRQGRDRMSDRDVLQGALNLIRKGHMSRGNAVEARAEFAQSSPPEAVRWRHSLVAGGWPARDNSPTP